MPSTRGLVLGVVGVIVVTTVVSGPLVPGVTLTAPHESTAYGQGNATVSDVRLPADAAFERASYGAENYHLTVQPARVQFSSLSGSPILSYRLEIDSLNYTRTTTHFLGPSTGDAYRLTMQSDTFAVGRITDTSYDGRLSVVKRDSTGDAVVGARNVTIEVVG